MEFLKGMFEGGGFPQAETLHEAFMAGDKEARDWCMRLTKIAKEKYMAKGKPMEGSIFLFVAVLRATGLIKQGVYHSVKSHGPGSVVKQAWDILDEALTAEDVDKAMTSIIERMTKEMPDG